MADMPWPGIVAVSGGGDSTALMLLLADWARALGKAAPMVAIVDHGLRAGSAAEAELAAARAGAAGLKAILLTRPGPAPSGDIEAFARAARYRLLGACAAARGLGAVYVGHTEDDLAETFLIRLARGSGVDGLAAMQPLSPYPLADFPSLLLVRPLLGFGREELRRFLAASGQDWLDDPMNRDGRFARVRIRENWPMLESLGLDKRRLIATARGLARARAALEAAAAELAAESLRRCDDGILVDPAVLAAAPREIGLRVLAQALMTVSGQDYRPRLERLERLYQAVCEGGLHGGRTLHGCRIGPAPQRMRENGRDGLVLIRQEARRLVPRFQNFRNENSFLN